MDYSVQFSNLGGVLNTPNNTVELNWLNYLDRVELNYTYEQMYSSVYFKPADDDYDYCSCTGSDKEELDSDPIRWMAHSNQFSPVFLWQKTVLLRVVSSKLKYLTETNLKTAPDLKILNSKLQVPTISSLLRWKCMLDQRTIKYWVNMVRN